MSTEEDKKLLDELAQLVEKYSDKADVIKRMTAIASHNDKITPLVAKVFLQRLTSATASKRVALLCAIDSFVKLSPLKSAYRELFVTVPRLLQETTKDPRLNPTAKAKALRIFGSWKNIFSSTALSLTGTETEEQFGVIYQNFLNDLSHEETRIFGLTAVSDHYSHFGPTIADLLIKKAKRTPFPERLPIFYLMDSIVQKSLSRDLYRKRFHDEGMPLLADTLAGLKEIIINSASSDSASPAAASSSSSSSSAASATPPSLAHINSAKLCLPKLTKLQLQWNSFFNDSGSSEARGRKSSSVRPPRPVVKRPRLETEDEPTITLPPVSVPETPPTRQWVGESPAHTSAFLKNMDAKMKQLVAQDPTAQPYVTEFWKMHNAGAHPAEAAQKSGLTQALKDFYAAREQIRSLTSRQPPPLPGRELNPAAITDLISALFDGGKGHSRPHVRASGHETMRKLASVPFVPHAFVPWDRIFDPDVLKRRDEAVINELYDQLTCVCCNCGLRKRTEEEMKVHLDWHYRQNLMKSVAADAPRSSRMWFKTPQEWVKKKLQVDAIEPKIEIADPIIGPPKPEPPPRFKIPVSSGTKDFCTVCGEKFEQFWDHDEDSWMFDEAVKVPHPDKRYEDHIADTVFMADRKALVRREKDKVDRAYRNHVLHRRCYQGQYELFDDAPPPLEAATYSVVSEEKTLAHEGDSDVQETTRWAFQNQNPPKSPQKNSQQSPQKAFRTGSPQKSPQKGRSGQAVSEQDELTLTPKIEDTPQTHSVPSSAEQVEEVAISTQTKDGDVEMLPIPKREEEDAEMLSIPSQAGNTLDAAPLKREDGTDTALNTST